MNLELIIIIILSIITVTIIVVSVYLILVLNNLKKAIIKTTQLLGDLDKVTGFVAGPVLTGASIITGLLESLKAAEIVSSLMGKKRRKKENE